MVLEHFKAILKRVLPPSVRNLVQVSRDLDSDARPTYLKLWLLRTLGLRSDQRRSLPPCVRQVLFVCHGNIIRSPMAAEWLRHCLSQQDRTRIVVTSAGLHARAGREADRRAREAALEFGISLDDHRAQPLTEDVVAQADLILVMDHKNEAELLARYPQAEAKTLLTGAFPEKKDEMSAIEDPYTGDRGDVRRCYQILQPCIHYLAAILAAQGLPGPNTPSASEETSGSRLRN